MTTLESAAIAHLRLLRTDPQPRPRDAYFVRLAYQYGVEPRRISEESLIPLPEVVAILLGL